MFTDIRQNISINCIYKLLVEIVIIALYFISDIYPRLVSCAAYFGVAVTLCVRAHACMLAYV